MHTKPWLSEIPWNKLESIHQSLCQTQKVSPDAGRKIEKARHLWDSWQTQPMPLDKALDCCKQCNDLVPFTYNSGNTFAVASQQLVEDWIQALPSFEAHMLRTSIGHYVNGRITKKELLDTLRHVETTWKSLSQPASPSEAQSAPQLKPA